jgi:hypothetical protein
MNVRVLELKTVGSMTLCLVAPAVQLPAAIRNHVKLANIYTGMTAAKEVFLLYIAKNNSSWYESAIEMMRLGRSVDQGHDEWVGKCLRLLRSATCDCSSGLVRAAVVQRIACPRV